MVISHLALRSASTVSAVNKFMNGGQMTTIKDKRGGRRPKKSQTQSDGDMERLTVRLLEPLNNVVRRAALYRGDISKTISEAIMGADLLQVKAIDLDTAGTLTKGTTIVIDRRVFQKLDAASKHRGASMNLLINSALAHKFGYPPKEKPRP
jgi:hypothetical protein